MQEQQVVPFFEFAQALPKCRTLLRRQFRKLFDNFRNAYELNYRSSNWLARLGPCARYSNDEEPAKAGTASRVARKGCAEGGESAQFLRATEVNSHANRGFSAPGMRRAETFAQQEGPTAELHI